MTSSPSIEQRAETFRTTFQHVQREIHRVFVGHDALVDHALIAFFCQGHALIEGAPGLGKTLLVRTIANTLRLSYARVQCTPDLLPGDVTGTNILAEAQDGARAFVFHAGPIFANIVLADEINRATPRTQSAFLEAMQEGHVTVFGTTHALTAPFSVFATQNPIEMEGTYALPEAQLDRFFFKLVMPSPTTDELAEIVKRTTGVAETTAAAGIDRDAVVAMTALIREVPVADDVLRMALRIVRATHPDADEAPLSVRKYVRYGASPRAAQTLILGAKARALLHSRYHVSRDDIRAIALAALRHRVLLNFQAELDRLSADTLVDDVLSTVADH
ncbi:MAG: MoxR family ATPase [Acidobacteriota bacterium]